MLVRAATPAERGALADAIGLRTLSPDARGIVAADSSGVRGGVLYDGWTENGVQVHMATSTPLAWRHLLPAVFEYPFLEAGRGVLVALVRSGNKTSVRMTQHLGFREVGRVADGASEGEDLILFNLRREHCRYLIRKAA